MPDDIHTITNLQRRVSLERALKQAIGEQRDVALGWLDLDNFDAVNTDFSHEVGDHVLRAVSGMFQQHASNVYHISGDEFAVLMPDVSLEQAFLKMERLRASVEAGGEQLNLPDGRAVHVTIGVAQFPRDAKDAAGLFKAADAALAAAKESGRNQVGLPPNENMVLKSSYYPASSLRRLAALAERLKRKESQLLREALDDLFRKYDVPREA